MADIMNGRYALADPSSGLTVLSFEGGELNMFGSCTRIRTTQRDFYPQIQDEPTELKVENHIMAQLVTGLVVAAALAAVAVAVVVTGGAALAPLACALGGAAIGAGAVAIGTAVSDLETGYNRSWGDYWQRMITGSSIGFMAGASVYGLIAAVPAAASAAGVQASMMLGTSTFTAVTVPSIVTAGGYGLAAAGGIYTVNDIYSNSRGYNIILDKVFDDNIEAYEAAGMVLDLFAEMYTNLGESNRALGGKADGIEKEIAEESSEKSAKIYDNENARFETVDRDAPNIEIKDKNSKQNACGADVQGEVEIRYCSERIDNEGKGEEEKLSVNLNKGEENKTNKSSESIGKGGNGQRENINNGASAEGIIIENENINDLMSRYANQVNPGVVVDPKKVRTSAARPFRGGETEAGHSYQKHGGRHPETWGKASGGPKQINNTAMQHIDNILNAPGNFGVTTVGNLQFLEKRLPDGRGLRLNMDGTFKGFID